jgi:HsdM N-terminal domain
MFEQAFRNIDDVLWKEAGCTTELDYTEQTSWLLFLKYLDDLETDKGTEAALEGRKYNFILEKQYRWESWAAPKGKDGKLDHNKSLTGDDLRDFVNGRLFPYLHKFKQKATGPNTIENKIGEIFGEIKNKIQSGYNLREIIDHIDELRFRSQTEKHELSHLYEAKIRNMGNGGEYYTPRPLIRAIVKVVAPRIGDRIYSRGASESGKGGHRQALQQQAASLPGVRSRPLRWRWSGRTGPGEADAITPAEISQLNCRCRRRPWEARGDKQGVRGISEVPIRIAPLRGKTWPDCCHESQAAKAGAGEQSMSPVCLHKHQVGLDSNKH